MNDGLDAIEKAIGAYLFTVWAIAPDDWPRGVKRPSQVTRRVEVGLSASRGGKSRAFLGIMSLIDEGIAARVTVVKERRARHWAARVLVTPAHRLPSGERPWGELNSLGELFLPPGVPRFLQMELRPGDKAKAGTYAFTLNVDGLDRTAQSGQITVKVRLP